MTKKLILLAAWLPLLGVAAESQEEIKKDIQRHRAMAAAHETAAKCLQAGQQPAKCQKDLQAACKGLAIGKYCGMKHEH